jgi:hypothetical protein
LCNRFSKIPGLQSNINGQAHSLQNVMDRQSSLLQRKLIIRLAAHSAVQDTESTFDDLFNASEMLSRSTFLRLGGTLFEHYIIAFGSHDDSIYVRRGVMKRQRAKKKSVYSESMSLELKKKYLVRFDLSSFFYHFNIPDFGSI